MLRRRAAVGLVALLLLVAGRAEAAAAAGAPVRLGAALSLTGSLSREGILTREGYELCVDVVNGKGGIPIGGERHPLEIAYQDDTSKPDTAAALVDQFNDSGRKFILGPYGSASTEAAAAVVERNGQVMLDSAGADDKIFTKGYRRTFAVLSPASQYLASIVRAVAELARPKPETVAIVSADDGFSKTAAAAGRAEAVRQGMRVVDVAYVPSGATDVSAALTRIRGKAPDLVLGSVHRAEGLAVVKQSAELGLVPVGFGETVAPPTPAFVTTLGPRAEGVLGSSQWTPETAGSDPWFGDAGDYAAAFEAKYRRAPQYHNAEASAACLGLVEGIRAAGTLEPERVRDAVAALDEPSFFGPIRFDASGKNVAKPMAVIQIQDGKAVTVWPTGTDTAPLRWPATDGAGTGRDSNEFLQALVNGLLGGGILALVGLGFSLVWGVTNIVNIAQGAFVVTGAFIGWELRDATGIDPLLGMLVAAAVLFVVGYTIQRCLVNLVVKAPVWMTLLLTFGLELLIVNGLIKVATSDLRSIPTGYATRSFDLGAVRVPYGRLLVLGVAVAATTVLVLAVGHTKTGRAIRAAGMDRSTATLMGVDVRHVYALTFGVGAALAGLAGVLAGTVGTFAPPDAGRYTLFSFVVAVLGGLGNMWGALAGGLLLGVVTALVGQYISPTLVNAAAFGVLLAVLAVRPSGLVGRPFYDRRVEAA